jgi:hypothetical protein
MDCASDAGALGYSVLTDLAAPVQLAVTSVDLARTQFATTSIYQFLFVPLTLGLAPLVAVMQTNRACGHHPDRMICETTAAAEGCASRPGV